MKGQSPLFSKGKDNWRTPKTLFEQQHAQWGFTIDGAADETNHLLPRWWGPNSSIAENALHVSWANERVWLNLPYSQIKAFMAKAYQEYLTGSTIVCLVPSRTDTKWWHDYVEGHQGVAYKFIKGRVKFIDPNNEPMRKGHSNSAPFPSVLVTYGVDLYTEQILGIPQRRHL